MVGDDLYVSNPLRDTLRACRRHFLYAALFSGLVNVLYLVPTIYMLQVYDRVVPTRGGATLLVLTIIAAVALAVFAALDMVRMQLLQRASLRLERLAAPQILHRVFGSIGATPAERSGAIRDFDTLRGVLTGPAIIALFDAPWLPVYLGISFLLHPLLGCLALVSALLLIALAVLGDYSSREQMDVAARRSAHSMRGVEYSIAGSEVARVLGMRGALVTRHLIDRADTARVQGQVAGTTGFYLACTKFLRLLLQSLALGLGAWLAIKQEISAGAIFAASLILGRALQPVEQILGAFRNVLSAQNAYRNLDRFCRLPDVAAVRTSLPAPSGRVEIDRVSLRVSGSDRAILLDVSMVVEPGQIVALVGPSGAGKSTFLRIIAGAIAPDQGEVRIDGARLDDWNRDQLGRYLGYMPQSPTLFPGSVGANISRFAAFDAASRAEIDDRVVKAAKLAGAHDFILRFADGYDTQLTPRETGGLSAGQRQMVGLARALYGEPRVVILDEPNAHLDNMGEQLLLEALARLRAGGTSVIVSTHRSGLLQAADKVMLLRDGRVELFGDRDQIVRRAPPVGREASPPRVDGGSALSGTGERK